MTHPDDLLVDYVDGALSGEDLRRVERHLVTCGRCRSEVVLAGGARAALATLVAPAVPSRVADRAIDEAEGGNGSSTVVGIHSRSVAPSWYRWAIGTAAAAALLVAVVALPHIGNGPGRQAAAPAAESDALGPAKRADTVEIEHRNYDTAAVQDLALTYRSSTQVPTTAEGDTTNGGANPQETPAAFSRELTPDATACLATAVPNPEGQLVRVIRARFEGTPAFIGVYLEGPGAGQPPDTVRVWVVSARGCSILTYTGAAI
jgi:Putative zinc-finger